MEPEIMTAISWGMVTTGAIGLIAAGTPLVRAVSRSLFGRAGGIFQYQEASAFLTKPEQQAFDYLQKALSGRGHVCPKVRIADLVDVDPTSLRETGDRMRASGTLLKSMSISSYWGRDTSQSSRSKWTTPAMRVKTGARAMSSSMRSSLRQASL